MSLLELACDGPQLLRGYGIHHKVTGLLKTIKLTSSSPNQLPCFLADREISSEDGQGQ